jgi:multimeric flavodoxin WrbA
MKRVIGIAGSPRYKGNSTTLLKHVLEGAESESARTDIIHLNELVYKGCQAYQTCSRDGKCTVKDALIPVFSALKLADVWVLASPVYFDSFSGQMKMFLDRCRHLCGKDGKRGPQLIGKRRAVIILTYEDNPNEHYLKVAQIQAEYLAWMGDFCEIEILSESNLSEASAVSNRPDLLEKARNLGKRLAKEIP